MLVMDVLRGALAVGERDSTLDVRVRLRCAYVRRGLPVLAALPLDDKPIPDPAHIFLVSGYCDGPENMETLGHVAAALNVDDYAAVPHGVHQVFLGVWGDERPNLRTFVAGVMEQHGFHTVTITPV